MKDALKQNKGNTHTCPIHQPINPGVSPKAKGPMSTNDPGPPPSQDQSKETAAENWKMMLVWFLTRFPLPLSTSPHKKEAHVKLAMIKRTKRDIDMGVCLFKITLMGDTKEKPPFWRSLS